MKIQETINKIIEWINEDVAECIKHAYDKEEAEEYKKKAEDFSEVEPLIINAPGMLQVCKNALADLEGIMPELEPSGDRKHPGWETIKELQEVIDKINGSTYKKFKEGIDVSVDKAYLTDEINLNSPDISEFAIVRTPPGDKEELVGIEYDTGVMDYVPQDMLQIVAQ